MAVQLTYAELQSFIGATVVKKVIKKAMTCLSVVSHRLQAPVIVSVRLQPCVTS